MKMNLKKLRIVRKKSEKVCLITGASRGIGKALALKLAEQGNHVVMVCRNMDIGKQVQREVIETTGNNKVELFNVDFESLRSVKSLSEILTSKFQRLDVLINNAGTFLSRQSLTDDGIETQFQVNYLSPFFLTMNLRGLMDDTPRARIINVGSNMHRIGMLNYGEYSVSKKYNGVKAYAQSKLCVLIFTIEMARRFEPISSNCYHPGAINTGIGSSNSYGFYKYGWMAIKQFFSGHDKGADTGVFLATSREVEGVSGKYFYKRKIVPLAKRCLDRKVGERLWNDSEEIIKQILERS